MVQLGQRILNRAKGVVSPKGLKGQYNRLAHGVKLNGDQMVRMNAALEAVACLEPLQGTTFEGLSKKGKVGRLEEGVAKFLEAQGDIHTQRDAGELFENVNFSDPDNTPGAFEDDKVKIDTQLLRIVENVAEERSGVVLAKTCEPPSPGSSGP